MGKIKSTVLYHTHGVITEERYQKMTTAQWIMHYKMIMEERRSESRNRGELIKSVAEPTFEILSDMFTQSAEFIGFFSNPKKFSEYLIEKNKKFKDPSAKTEEERLNDEFDFLLQDNESFPEYLSVDLPVDRMKSTDVKKISKRMVGIQKK